MKTVDQAQKASRLDKVARGLFVYTLQVAQERDVDPDVTRVLERCVQTEDIQAAKKMYTDELEVHQRRALKEVVVEAKARFLRDGPPARDVQPDMSPAVGEKRKADDSRAVEDGKQEEDRSMFQIKPMEMAVHLLLDKSVSPKLKLRVELSLVEFSTRLSWGPSRSFFGAMRKILGMDAYVATTKALRSGGFEDGYSEEDALLDATASVQHKLCDPDAKHAMAAPLFLLRCWQELSKRGLVLPALRARLVGLCVSEGARADLNQSQSMFHVVGSDLLALLLSQAEKVSDDWHMTPEEAEELSPEVEDGDEVTGHDVSEAFKAGLFFASSRKSARTKVKMHVHPAFVVAALRGVARILPEWRTIESARVAELIADVTNEHVGRLWIELCDGASDFLTHSDRANLTNYLYDAISDLSTSLRRTRYLKEVVAASFDIASPLPRHELASAPLSAFDPDGVSALRKKCSQMLREACVKRTSMLASAGASEDCAGKSACTDQAVALETQVFAAPWAGTTVGDYVRAISLGVEQVLGGDMDTFLRVEGPVLLARGRARA